MGRFMLGSQTVLDEQACEYQWLQQQLNLGVPPERLQGYVQSCFGGNQETAEAMLLVVEGKMSRLAFAELLKKQEKEFA